MNFFSSLSSRHNHGIPVQNNLLFILFFFCSVQTVNAADKLCGVGEEKCGWTDSANGGQANDECACYYEFPYYDKWTCGNSRGMKLVDQNYQGNEFVRKIWCRGCTDKQTIASGYHYDQWHNV
jgi:hypothetical protein